MKPTPKQFFRNDWSAYNYMSHYNSGYEIKVHRLQEFSVFSYYDSTGIRKNAVRNNIYIIYS